jgi:hypothetical protein
MRAATAAIRAHSALDRLSYRRQQPTAAVGPAYADARAGAQSRVIRSTVRR